MSDDQEPSGDRDRWRYTGTEPHPFLKILLGVGALTFLYLIAFVFNFAALAVSGILLAVLSLAGFISWYVRSKTR